VPPASGCIRCIPCQSSFPALRLENCFDTESSPDGLAVLGGVEAGVQLAAGEDGGVGDADLLDLFEVEEARAVGERVQGHDAHRRLMGVDQGQGEHGRFLRFRD
jgi:hypothetical protein